MNEWFLSLAIVLAVTPLRAQELSKAIAPGSTTGTTAIRIPTPLVDTTNPSDSDPRGSANKPVIFELARTDPSAMTTAQLIREITLLRDRHTSDLDARKELMNARFAAIDEAVKLLQANVNRQPLAGEVALQVKALDSLTDERIRTHKVEVEKMLADAKDKIEQQFADNHEHLTTALSSARLLNETQDRNDSAAFLKMEVGFTKQLDAEKALVEQIQTTANGQLADLKTRINLMEGRDKGSSDLWGYIVGGVGLLFGLLSLLGIGFTMAIKPHVSTGK